LIARVGACTLGLLALFVMTYEWLQAQSGPVWDVIAAVIWDLYAVSQVALIVVLLFVAYRYITRDRSESASQLKP